MAQWKTIPNITDEMLDNPNFVGWFQNIVKSVEEENRQIQAAIDEHYHRLLVEASYLWGDNSNEFKYLKRAVKPTAVSIDKKIKAVWKRYYDRIEAKRQKILAAERKAARDAKAEQRRLQREEEERLEAIAEEQRLEAQREERRLYKERQEEAVYILTEKGFVPDQDFTRSNAISFLKKVNDEKKSADEEAELLRIERLNQFELEATSYEA